jgi:hypothetical protein
MTTEQELKDKLRKIEALFAGAATQGDVRTLSPATALPEPAGTTRMELHPWSQMRPTRNEIFFSTDRQKACHRYGKAPYWVIRTTPPILLWR